jgi:hydrogenase maturation protease
VRAVETLQRAYRLPPAVEVIDGCTSGMEMLDDLAHADHLFIVDAVKSGQPPASLVTLKGEAVPAFFGTKLSPHQIGLADVLAALTLTGERPANTVLFGVEPASLATGMALSPPVAARLPELVGAIAGELCALGLAVAPLRSA